MPCHHFKNRLEGQVPTLRMVRRAVECGRVKRLDQITVPPPRRSENRKRFARGISRIVFCPSVLIEGLKRWIVLRQRLPQPEGKHQLAVRQVANDLPRAPFAGGPRLLRAGRSHLRKQFFNFARRGRDYFFRVSISQLRCVWIHDGHHNRFEHST